MKKKFAKLCLGLTLGAMTLTGCGNSSFAFPGGESGGGGFPGLNSNAGGGGGGTNGYSGDKTRSVGTITNMPASKYKDSTLDKIEELTTYMFGDGDGDKDYVAKRNQEVVDAMLAFKIGDNLAVAICDFVPSSTLVRNYKSTSEWIDAFVDFCYDGLKILNSVDWSNMAAFFEKINELYKKARVEEDGEPTSYSNIRDYLSPSIDGNGKYNCLSYRQYQCLKKFNQTQNDAGLNDIINAYSFYDTFAYTDEQAKEYQDYKNGTGDEYEEYYIFPQEIISFVKNHAKSYKSTLINKLKLIVDAIGECFKNTPELFSYFFGVHENEDDVYYDYNERGRDEILIPYTYTDSYGYTYNDTRWFYSDYQGEQAEARTVTRQLFLSFLKNRNIIVGLFKSVYADNEFGNLLIDVAKEIVVPMLTKSYPQTENNKKVLNNLTSRLKALSGKHIAAVANLAVKVADEVSSEDIANLFFNDYDEGSFNWEAFIDLFKKNYSKFGKILSSTSASDKKLINEVAAIFGIDIFDQLTHFLTIFEKAGTIEDEKDYETVNSQMSSWSSSLVQTVMKELALEYDDYYGNEEGVKIRAYFNYSPSMDDDYDSAIYKMRISYYDYFSYQDEYGRTSYSSVSVTYDVNSWNDYVQTARNNWERMDKNSLDSDDYNYYYHRYYLFSQMSLNDINVSNLNLNRVGYTNYEVSLTLGGKSYSYKSRVFVNPREADIVGLETLSLQRNGTANYYKNYSNDLFNYFNSCYIVDQYCDLYYYDSSSYGYTYLDTTKKGWNFVVRQVNEYDYSYFRYAFYYVVDPAELKTRYLQSESYSTGYYIEGDNSFYNTPYRYYYYQIGDIRFYESYSCSFNSAYVEGKTPNRRYTFIANDGRQYEMVIFGLNTRKVYNYDFRLGTALNEPINNGITMECSRVYIYYRYSLTLDGYQYTISGNGDYFDNVYIYNFTYVDNTVNFTYNGETFTFRNVTFPSYY